MNYYSYRAYLLDTIKAARAADLGGLVKAVQRDMLALRKRFYSKR